MHVLVTGPFTSAYAYFSAAKDMDMQISVITTNRDGYAIPEAMQEKIDHFVVIDDLELDTLVGAATRLHKQYPLDGIVAGFELLVEQTACIADVIGLPFTSIEHATNVRNKAAMRQALHDAGVRAPRFAQAASAIDLENVAETIGFPAVIKPLKMAGSLGVVRVGNTVELLAAYEDIVQDAGGWGNKFGTEVLMEELLVGPEYIVDGYITSDGDITVHEFGLYELGPQPHFQILGCTLYRAEDLPGSTAMAEYIKTVVRAVGIAVGPFHAEIILTKDGPVLVEIANRLPGANVPALSEYITGISFAKCALATVTKTPLPEPAEPKARVAAFRCITAPRDLLGKAYTKLVGWEELASDPAVDDLTVYIKPGEPIPEHTDERSWIAEVRYHADSPEAAEIFRKKILDTVHVE